MNTLVNKAMQSIVDSEGQGAYNIEDNRRRSKLC